MITAGITIGQFGIIFITLLKTHDMKTKLIQLAMIVLVAAGFTSCVAKRKLTEANATIQRLQSDSTQLASQVARLQSDITTAQNSINQLGGDKSALQKELDAIRKDANNKLNNSRETIASQQQRLQQLQALIDRQRAATNALKQKISTALNNFSASDLTVSTKNGKVYVSLSENLLFPSGSAVVNIKGKQALKQLADVLNMNNDINVEIEGHTDSVPIKGRYEDNWALSVARATAIVRILTQTYKVDPIRVTASGRSKYEPVDTNGTSQGRANNRRTEIILEPKLDELMKLIQQDPNTTP